MPSAIADPAFARKLTMRFIELIRVAQQNMRLGQKPDDMAFLLIVDDGQRLIFALLEVLRGELDVHPRQQENIGLTREGAKTGGTRVPVQSGDMHVGSEDHSCVTAR